MKERSMVTEGAEDEEEDDEGQCEFEPDIEEEGEEGEVVRGVLPDQPEEGAELGLVLGGERRTLARQSSTRSPRGFSGARRRCVRGQSSRSLRYTCSTPRC